MITMLVCGCVVVCGCGCGCGCSIMGVGARGRRGHTHGVSRAVHSVRRKRGGAEVRGESQKPWVVADVCHHCCARDARQRPFASRTPAPTHLRLSSTARDRVRVRRGCSEMTDLSTSAPARAACGEAQHPPISETTRRLALDDARRCARCNCMHLVAFTYSTCLPTGGSSQNHC